jgi:hypothetical protein
MPFTRGVRGSKQLIHPQAFAGLLVDVPAAAATTLPTRDVAGCGSPIAAKWVRVGPA